MAYEYEEFKKDIHLLTNIDLNAYKEQQMKRRITSLYTKHSFKGFQDYVAALKKDKALYEEFLNYFTINVSEFYRNPEQWKLMDSDVIPLLISRFGENLKIWSAACSTGDEPYSLVMALSRHIPLNKINIYATDIDKQVIEKAKTGLYSAKSIVSVPDDLKKKYFTDVGGAFQISDEIKSRVRFAEHNLILNNFQKDFNFIVCRNVLIYFTEEAKEEVFEKFFYSLKPGGILFIGSTEQISSYKEIGYTRKSSFYYERPEKQ
ncbi:MAG: protein-glutamate O-methyltransferase CheR [Lachnospiraceae bacterium]|nr:protein-glutamate O-methyltransferase CheR [Lachnospiraceae bacterium]